MSLKKDKILIILISGIIFLLTGIDLATKDRLFSESENRILEKKPEFEWKSFLEGTFGKQYETYVTDQFVFRDNWILLKTYADIGMAKKEINGVYRAADNILIEQHLPEELEEKAEIQIKKLEELAKWCDGNYFLSVMLVPTADIIYHEKLPKYAPYFDQQVFLKKVKEAVGDSHFIPVWEELEKHKNEYIYYRTDHHWTTLGAFYAYQAWAERTGESPLPLSRFTRETITDSFLGTLHAKVNIPIEPDSIELFLPKKESRYAVYYDFEKEAADSFYEKSYLNKKDKYSVFLNGNHAFIEINTGNTTGKSVVIIKDSYANCYIPFLAEHYENIYVVDFRYYRGSLEDILEEYKAEDVLVLYNVVHFILKADKTPTSIGGE